MIPLRISLGIKDFSFLEFFKGFLSKLFLDQDFLLMHKKIK